jgi:GT2 family glycosyltransferase
MISHSNRLPISVLICSRDRPQFLAETIESIWRGRGLPAEIVVVDQSAAPHSSLASASGPAGCRLRYFWRAVPGVSRARNFAVAAARHEMVAFLDDDVLVSADWLDNLLSALAAAGPKCVVTGRVRAGIPEVAGGFCPSSIVDDAPAVYSRPTIARDVLFTGNMAMYRGALLEVGGFDERLGPGTRFPAAEDNDLAFRLLKADYQIAYVPDAVIYHRAWRSEYLAIRWKYGKGQGAFYAKHLLQERGYALDRFRHDTHKYLSRSFRGIRTDRLKAMGDTAFVMGLYLGASEWLLERILAR